MKHPDIRSELLDSEPGDKSFSAIPRDASAAALIASALYELATYLPDCRLRYEQAANHILDSLDRYYRAQTGSDHGFLLLHSTGHYPAGSEIDVPLVYADYYYLEAQARRAAMEWK